MPRVAPPGGPAVTGDQIVSEVRKFLGDPYVWGATGPAAFDCSGLVQYALARLGIRAPRTSEDQWNWVERIPASQARPGDLVFFTGGDPPSPGHVGILTAPGTAQHGPEMIDAPHTGALVEVASFDPAGTGVNQVVGYGRVPGSAAGTQALATGGGGLLSWPGEVLGFFSDADHALATASHVALAFFQPSTYVRLAVGGLAMILLVAGLLFLVRAAA